MTVTIPHAGGVPGISGPPDWFNAPPAGSYRLDDVNWRGATKRTFGGGGSQSISFRALQAVDGGQQYIYLSFWAAFVQELADERDSVFLGLQASGGGTAMVIHMQAHGPTFAHSGPPPDTNPPANIPLSVQAWTRAGGAASWTAMASPPTWIHANARAWLQDETHVAADPNNRWAVQLRIPVQAAGTITDNSGPNLGTSFNIWYLIRGSAGGSTVILADSRPSGTTAALDLITSNFPAPSSWDQAEIATGPAAFGGVALEWSDVVVQNAAYGEGSKIDNGVSNTFVARPRNYRPPGNDIAAGDINATFRIANWGSVAGDVNKVDFSTGQWDYVPGNSELAPVPSTLNIPSLAAGSNPPATDPIALSTVMNLPPGKSLHQCVLVTLSGNNLIFLNDSVYRNMNYDTASLLASEATINILDLEPRPRDVYLAVEKVNMPQNVPSGTDEGQFLQSSMRRLMAQGGPLTAKLKSAKARLAEGGDHGSEARLEAVLSGLHEALAQLEYRDAEQGLAALRRLIATLKRWLSAVKKDGGAAKQLADLFDAAADWLGAGGLDSVDELAAFVGQLSQWLANLANDPASSELLPNVLHALRNWLSTLADGEQFLGLIDRLARWLEAGRSANQLPAFIDALRELLGSLSGRDSRMAAVFASFALGTASWLRGSERLNALVQVLAGVGLTTEELDQLFPTLRIHVYYDTGERMTGSDGMSRPVLSVQPSFGLYAYHEGSLEGWQTSLEGAQRIAANLYLLAVPNSGKAKVMVKVQAVQPGEERIPEDPIKPIDDQERCGCLCQIRRLLGLD